MTDAERMAEINEELESNLEKRTQLYERSTDLKKEKARLWLLTAEEALKYLVWEIEVLPKGNDTYIRLTCAFLLPTARLYEESLKYLYPHTPEEHFQDGFIISFDKEGKLQFIFKNLSIAKAFVTSHSLHLNPESLKSKSADLRASAEMQDNVLELLDLGQE